MYAQHRLKMIIYKSNYIIKDIFKMLVINKIDEKLFITKNSSFILLENLVFYY